MNIFYYEKKCYYWYSILYGGRILYVIGFIIVIVIRVSF